MKHRGPIQEFTETCQACGRNVWDSDECEPEIGGYVNDSPYLEMRLRMKLTGTASPSNEEWASALRTLLTHLGDNP
jgi:hypothetical protein